MSSNLYWPREPYKGYEAFWAAEAAKLFAVVILLEAGAENELGKHAVAQVVINRCKDEYKRYGNGIHEVLLKKYQFSCLNPDSRDKALKLLWGAIPDSAIVMATAFIDGHLVCPAADSANHYLNIELTKKGNDGKLPDWVNKMAHVITIGKHDFYKGI